jgi:hypothetical protein
MSLGGLLRLHGGPRARVGRCLSSPTFRRPIHRLPGAHGGRLQVAGNHGANHVHPRQRRGAKRSTRIRSVDLPQGAVELEPLERDVEKPSYPTVVQQARNNMRRFGNCVLLTRVGSFYEVFPPQGDLREHKLTDGQLYFDQADKYGPLLGLKVAQKRTSAGPVSMV